jgi:hypothetical protein
MTPRDRMAMAARVRALRGGAIDRQPNDEDEQ